MKIKEYLKELWIMLFVPPNSPQGMRHRAKRLEKEFGPDNPMVTALRKMADLKEREENDA